MTRRARGEGSLSKYVTTSGRVRWRAQWREPVNADDPRLGTRQRSLGGFETRAAARDALLRQLAGVKEASLSTRGAHGPTFFDYATGWLARYQCEPTTRLYIHRVIDAVAPYIGRLTIADVRPTDLAIAYRGLETGRKPSHTTSTVRGPLAPSTVLRYSGWLVTIFNAAIEDGLLDRNPASHRSAGRPRGPRARRTKPFQVWNAEQTRQFCSWAISTEQPWAHAWAILARTGLRSGELLALRWSDIDVRAATLTVERALRYNASLPKGERYEVTLPKNGRPCRIALDQGTVQLFEAWREEVMSINAALGLISGPVFVAVAGRAPTQSGLRSAFARVQAAFKAAHPGIHLPELTVHDLRHTHASLLLASGADIKVIQERLGHASATITLNTYAHLMPNAQHVAVNLLEELLER